LLCHSHCIKEEVVNASSRNGTLGTHPSLHPPKWESLENVFQKVLNKTFQLFLQQGCTIFNPFFMHFGQFPTFDVQKVPLLLDAFTVGSDMQVIIFQRGESPRKCGVQNLLCPLHRPNPALWKEYPCPSIFFHWVWPRVSLHNRTSSCGYSRHRFT